MTICLFSAERCSHARSDSVYYLFASLAPGSCRNFFLVNFRAERDIDAFAEQGKYGKLVDFQNVWQTKWNM